MRNNILMPQEVETHYVIPTLRRYITEHLKNQGMKQKDIAKIFNVNTATISQYKNKRGHKIDFNEEIITEIEKSSQNIKDTLSYIKETQYLLKFLRNTNALCTIHHQLSNLPINCKPEIVGCHIQ